MPLFSSIFGTIPRIWIVACVVVLCFGGYLRMYSLGSQPYWMDEGYTINATLSILERGSTTLDSGTQYSCPTYCYPTAAIAGIFGENAFSFRLLAALAGIAVAIAVYFIARGWFSPTVGLFASLITTLSYYQVAWSRQARWYTLFELFFWLALFFFYQTLYGEGRRTRAMYGILCIAATALAIATHGLGYVLPIIFALWLLIDRLILHREHRPALLVFALSGLLSLFFLTDPGRALLSAIDFFFALPYYASFYLSAYALFFVLAALALWLARRERAVWYIVLALFAYVIPLGFMTEVIHYRYLFHLTPALFILGALGLDLLRMRFGSTYRQATLIGVILLLFVTLGGGIVTPRSFYFLEADDPEKNPGRSYYAYTPQPDWNSAYAYIAANRAENDIVISSMPQFNKIFLGEPGYWITYNYYGMEDTGELIQNDKEYYVGAQVVDDLEELQSLTASKHGYIVFDYMATDARVAPEILEYIGTHFKKVFEKRENSYSEVWVYKF